MKALSLHQPYASAVALSLKPWETRPWLTHYRGPLVIHASLKEFDYRHYDMGYFTEVCMRLSHAKCPQYALPYGCAVCVVDLVDCVPTGKVRGRIGQYEFWGDFRDVGDDGKKRYAFKLENPRKLWPRPKVRGGQKFFEIPDEVLKYE